MELTLGTPKSARSPRLGVLGGTDREFAQMLDTIRVELAPEGLIEALLVDRIVLAIARLRRVARVELGEVEMEAVASTERSLDAALAELDARRRREGSGWGRAAQVSTRIGDLAGLPPLPCEGWPADAGAFESEGGDEDDRDDVDAAPSVASAPHWRTRLVFDENVSDNSPVIRGTWVTAGQIVSLIVDGWTWDDILRQYPELTEGDIRACLAFTVEQDGPVKL